MVDFIGVSLRQSDQLSQSEASELVDSVRAYLADDDTFNLQLRSNSLDGIDFRWHQNGPPHVQNNATILCLRDGSADPIALGMSHGANLNRPTADLFLNWIGHHDSSRDYATPPDWTEAILFDVDKQWSGGVDEYVYHYTTWPTAREFILGGLRQLLVNPITRMGDPLEFEDINVTLSGGIDDEQLPLRVWTAIRKATRYGIKLLCVSQDQKAVVQQPANLIHQTALRGFAHPSMWHHYGADHEGVCLVFNKVRLHEAVAAAVHSTGRVFCGSVAYQRNNEIWKTGPSIGEDQAAMTEADMETWAREQMFQHWRTLFLTKHTDWKPETEYRWVVASSSDDPLFVPIANSLVAVVVGSDFDSGDHRELEVLAGGLNVPVRRIWWRNGEPNPPSDLKAFESGGPLETWETKAAARRSRRRPT